MAKKESVPFSVLNSMRGTIDDSNNLVWTGLLFKESDIPEIESWFKEIGLIDKNSKIEWIATIDGNVKGKNGRSDVYIRLTGKGVINPLVRLQVDGLMWYSDFIDNFKDDYFLD